LNNWSEHLEEQNLHASNVAVPSYLGTNAKTGYADDVKKKMKGF
jgi:hypothetical protein